MKRIFLLLIMKTSLASFSQGNLNGNVKDYKSNEYLLGADIVLLDTKIGTATNNKGAFELKNIPEGTYKVAISYVGYHTFFKKITIKKNKVKSINISLKEKTLHLDEVSITGKSKIRKMREKAMPVTIISMQQLGGKATSISDVILKTTGVTVRTSGGVGSASRISVRGLEGKRIGFFIDETPLNDHSDFVGLNDIPIDLIERIEIYKGVVPAKFGGSALGGAVNIVIKKYPDRYADISYTHASFNTNIIQFVAKRNMKEKGLVFGLGGGYTYSDNDYMMDIPQEEGLRVKREHDRFKNLVVGGNVRIRKWWFDEIELEPIFIDTYREIQGIKSDIKEALIKSRAYILVNRFEKDDFLLNGLDLDITNTFAVTKYNLIDKSEYLYDWQGNSYRYGGELERFKSDSDNQKTIFLNRINIEYLIDKQHAINFNSFFTLANGKPKDELRKVSLNKQTLFDSKMRSWVGGISYDFNTKNDVFLNSLTVRLFNYSMKTKVNSIYGFSKIEHININKFDIGISAAMRYRFTPTWIGKFSIGHNVRIPSETELLGDAYAISPSETLLPEKNMSANIGFLYHQKESKNLQIEFNSFYMYLKDMIRLQKGIIGAQYQNFGKMKTLGIELEIKADIFPSLYGYINSTYQDLRDVREFEENSRIVNPKKDKRMPNIPYLLANMGLEFHKENLFGGEGENTRIFTDVSFVEEYFYDFEMTEKKKRRIPRSTTVDIGFEHSFYNNRLFISGYIKNLTNSKLLSEFNRPLPPINFGMKLRYIFK